VKRRANVNDEGLLAYMGGMDLETLYERYPSSHGIVYFDWMSAGSLPQDMIDIWLRVKPQLPAGTRPPWKRAEWLGAPACLNCECGFYVWDMNEQCGKCVRCLDVVSSMREARQVLE
jgi:hypothetical protein